MRAWSLLRGEQQRRSSASSRERLYSRFQICDERVAKLTLEEGNSYTVKDLSYGGISFLVDDSHVTKSLAEAKQKRQVVPATLNLLGEEIDCMLEPVVIKDSFISFRFQHEKSEVLEFLKRTLTFLDYGLSLADSQSQRFRDDNQLWYEAVSSKDVVAYIDLLDRVVKPDAALYHIVYRVGHVHYALEYSEDLTYTFQTVGPGAEIQDIYRTEEIDANILKKSLLITLGFNQELEDEKISEIRDKLIDMLDSDSDLKTSLRSAS